MYTPIASELDITPSVAWAGDMYKLEIAIVITSALDNKRFSAQKRVICLPEYKLNWIQFIKSALKFKIY